MRVIKGIDEFRIYRQGLTGRVGFVPTMGFLHEGHLSLVEAARRECAQVVVSIFVNPTQFGPNEDFDRYPRDFERDQELCARAGVDAVFYPEVKEMYPGDELTTVRVARITEPLCGRSRPAHFEGVTTVVAKLFNIVQPQAAFFGQKDLQQSIVVCRMVRDLSIPVEIKVCPIFREPDGLAMSSRNKYLRAEERKLAPALCRALERGRELYQQGETDPAVLRAGVQQSLRDAIGGAGRVDYIEVVDTGSLSGPVKAKRGDAIALAVYFGKTRLIDNLIL